MAISPFLQMLLRPKRRLDVPYDDPNEFPAGDVNAGQGQPMDERGARIASSPTIAIRPRYRDAPSNAPSDDPRIMAKPLGNGTWGERVIDPTGRSIGLGTERDYEPLAQQPTVPVNGTVKPTISLKARDPWDERIAADQERIRTAQNKPHNRKKEVLEGLGTWAAGGFGIPLQRILHPRGTEEQQAQKQLATDVALRKASTEAQDAQSTIALRSAQARKIDADIQAAIDHPETSDAEKQKLEVARDILRSHPQPFDPNDPQDAIAIKKITDAGIPIPKSYGKQPKPAGPPKTGTVVEGGIKYQTEFDPETHKWVKSVDGEGQPIVVEEAKPEEGAPPDTTQGWIELEKGHRTNAANAQKAAEKAEADVKTYIAQQKAADPKYDATKDANVAGLTAEARRQRDYAVEQLKAADQAAAKKIEAANTDARAKSKVKKSSSVVKPAKDGKYHYTPDQIRSSLQPGQSYEEIYQKLKANPKVAIDE